jgi:hypothetical protein
MQIIRSDKTERNQTKPNLRMKVSKVEVEYEVRCGVRVRSKIRRSGM